MIYSFQCLDHNCAYEFEAKIRIAKIDEMRCPRCGAGAEKLFAATSNVFIPAYFYTMKSDVFDYQDWRNLKKNPNMERAK